jgi:3-phosphoshikimate 1-carboxyvinyltransferase
VPLLSLVVQPLKTRLHGSVPVCSDKSITHRALLLSALATGVSEICANATGEDNLSTQHAFAAMGVRYATLGKDVLSVTGVGLHGLTAPSSALDCGNSGTTMRLMLGVLVGQPFASELVGDASLTRRPMARVVSALRAREAHIFATLRDAGGGVKETAPLRVRPLEGGKRLTALELESDVASAQVKSAVLLSGLYADGPTLYREPSVSRDHTERFLLRLGVPLRTLGPMVELDPSRWSGELPAFKITVPGDLSAAAFLLAAAAMHAGSNVEVRDVGLNPTRSGILEVLTAMGAHVEVSPRDDDSGEPMGRVQVVGQGLRAANVGGERLVRSLDEVPVIAALAARAHGVTRIRDAAELRTKESDRLSAMCKVLRAFGVVAEEHEDGLTIEGAGDRPLRAARVSSEGDHRIAMSAAVLALFAEGESIIDDAGCVATSFPRFAGTMRALGADVVLRA